MPINKLQLVSAIRPRVQNVKWHRRTIRLHDTDVVPAKLARFPDAAGMCKNFDLMHHAIAIIRHLDRLVGRIEPPLEPGIVCRDAGGAGILVAFERLNASEGEHESPCRNYKIRAGTQGPGYAGWCDEFARSNQADAITQPMCLQNIGDHRQ